jgi:adenosylhomocysteinase
MSLVDGSGQSTVLAVADATNLLVAGKRVAVIGYGRVGKSVARRARGLGAEVIVCEVDPFAAVEAFHGGFDVLPVEEACAAADIVLAATGSSGALPPAAIERLRDGALLASCRGGGALDIPALRERALETRRVRESVEELVLDEERSVFLVGGGLAVDLAAGEGAPVELVDLTCSVQALAARYLLRHGAELTPKVHLLPYAIDEGIALRKLETLGLEIDRLTEKQRASRSG